MNFPQLQHSRKFASREGDALCLRAIFFTRAIQLIPACFMALRHKRCAIGRKQGPIAFVGIICAKIVQGCTPATTNEAREKFVPCPSSDAPSEIQGLSQ